MMIVSGLIAAPETSGFENLNVFHEQNITILRIPTKSTEII